MRGSTAKRKYGKMHPVRTKRDRNILIRPMERALKIASNCTLILPWCLPEFHGKCKTLVGASTEVRNKKVNKNGKNQLLCSQLAEKSEWCKLKA